jgi:hypothetical protein
MSMSRRRQEKKEKKLKNPRPEEKRKAIPRLRNFVRGVARAIPREVARLLVKFMFFAFLGGMLLLFLLALIGLLSLYGVFHLDRTIIDTFLFRH